MADTISGLSGAGGGDKLRLTGMATGLDVDATVKKMMAAEQIKLDKIKQNRQAVAWRQELYQDIIKDLKDLQSSYFDATSSDKNILSSATFSPFDVSVANNTVASITAGVGGQAGNYALDVISLAKGAGSTKDLTGKLLSTKLSEIGVTDDADGNVSLVLNTGGSDMTVKVKSTSTISELVTAINNGTGGTVKASFSEVTGKLSICSAKTGENAKLTMTAGSQANLTALTGSVGETTHNYINDATSNAQFKITLPGGESKTLTKDSNNFTLDGISYTLSATGTTTFSVSQDTGNVYDKLKGFIDKYNAIVDKIQTKLTEKKNYSYKPLTDAQKSSMKDTEIKAWEDKAKQGCLRNDDNLQKLLTDLRTSFSTAVTDAGFSVGKYGTNSIGIDFSSDYSKPAHIDIVDAAKLKSVIASNSSGIMKLFSNVSTTSNTLPYDSQNPKYKEDGIFTRVKKILESNVGLTNVTLNSSILTKYANFQDDYSSYGGGSGTNTLADQLYQKDLQIKNLQKLMSTKQESYYQKFAKLETAMNTLNAQQSQLSQMLGG